MTSRLVLVPGTRVGAFEVLGPRDGLRDDDAATIVLARDARGGDWVLRVVPFADLVRRGVGDSVSRVEALFIFARGALAALAHRRVVPVEDGFVATVDAADRGPLRCGVLRSPALTGGSLETVLASGDVRPADASRWARQIAEALAFAHARATPLPHLALEPAHVVLDGQGNACVGGWGEVFFALRGGSGRAATVGLPWYFAPERWNGGEVGGEFDLRDDVWAWGLLALQLVLGASRARVYDGECPAAEPERLRASVEAAKRRDAVLGRLIEQALSPRPEDRPALLRVAEELLRSEAAAGLEEVDVRRLWAASNAEEIGLGLRGSPPPVQRLALLAVGDIAWRARARGIEVLAFAEAVLACLESEDEAVREEAAWTTHVLATRSETRRVLRDAGAVARLLAACRGNDSLAVRKTAAVALASVAIGDAAAESQVRDAGLEHFIANAQRDLDRRPRLKPGALLDGGAYRMDAELGTGAFATTVTVLDREDQRWTVKAVLLEALAARMPPELTHEQLLEFVNREVRKLLALSHDHVVRFVDSWEETIPSSVAGRSLTCVCVRMAHLPGGSLVAAIDRQDYNASHAVRLLLGVARGLRYAHELPSGRIAHGELKPENVCLNDREEAVIIDWAGSGTAVMSSVISEATKVSRSRAPVLIAEDVAMGTEWYKSPERLAHEGALPSDDVWALGLLALQVLLGVSEEGISPEGLPPGRDPTLLQPAIAEAEAACPSIRPFLEGCLAPDPASRWTSTRAGEELTRVRRDIDARRQAWREATEATVRGWTRGVLRGPNLFQLVGCLQAEDPTARQAAVDALRLELARDAAAHRAAIEVLVRALRLERAARPAILEVLASDRTVDLTSAALQVLLRVCLFDARQSCRRSACDLLLQRVRGGREFFRSRLADRLGRATTLPPNVRRLAEDSPVLRDLVLEAIQLLAGSRDRHNAHRVTAILASLANLPSPTAASAAGSAASAAAAGGGAGSGGGGGGGGAGGGASAATLPPWVASFLVDRLHSDGDGSTRLQLSAARALASLADVDTYRPTLAAAPGLVDSLVRGLGDSNTEVRVAALDALAALCEFSGTRTRLIASPRGMDALEACLRSDSTTVRAAAAQAIRHFSADEVRRSLTSATRVVEGLVAGLRDSDRLLRRSAAQALTSMVRGEAFRLELVHLPGAIDALRECLRDADADARRAAAAVFATLVADSGPDLEAHLIAALKHATHGLRSAEAAENRAARWALAALAAEPTLRGHVTAAAESTDGLAACLMSEDSLIRRTAAQALATLGATPDGQATIVDTPGVVEGLLRCLHDSDDVVRRTSSALLSLLATHTPLRPLIARSPDAMELFVAQLRDGHALVRRSAAHLLASVAADPALRPVVARSAGVVDRLLFNFNTIDALTRRAVATTLQLIAVDPTLRPFVSGVTDAVEALIDHLTDADGPVRQHAATALAALVTEPGADSKILAAVAHYTDNVDSKDGRTCQTAVTTVALLTAEPALRPMVASAPGIVPKIVGCLRDIDWFAGQAAAAALAALTAEPTVEASIRTAIIELCRDLQTAEGPARDTLTVAVAHTCQHPVLRNPVAATNGAVDCLAARLREPDARVARFSALALAALASSPTLRPTLLRPTHLIPNLLHCTLDADDALRQPALAALAALALLPSSHDRLRAALTDLCSAAPTHGHAAALALFLLSTEPALRPLLAALPPVAATLRSSFGVEEADPLTRTVRALAVLADRNIRRG